MREFEPSAQAIRNWVARADRVRHCGDAYYVTTADGAEFPFTAPEVGGCVAYRGSYLIGGPVPRARKTAVVSMPGFDAGLSLPCRQISNFMRLPFRIHVQNQSTANPYQTDVNGGAKRDRCGGVKRDHLASVSLSP